MDVLQFALQQVNNAFPGVFNIPLADASRFIGISPKTARNQLSRGCAPFETITRGGLRYVPAPSLAAVVAADMLSAKVDISSFNADGISAEAIATTKSGSEPVKRGRGRPRKVAATGEVAA